MRGAQLLTLASCVRACACTAGALLRLPELFIGTSIFSLIVYFSVGFIVDVGRFWIFWLAMFAQAWMGVNLFVLMGALTRSDVLAQGLGAVVCLMFIATSGFPIARCECLGRARLRPPITPATLPTSPPTLLIAPRRAHTQRPSAAG